MEFIKWLLSCGWKGCHSARWQWKCLHIAGQCSQYLMLEMWKQLCTRVVFDIFSVLSWWICGFIKPHAVHTEWVKFLDLWILELCLLPEQLYWHTCCDYRAWETGIASISLPSAALVLHCHEQLDISLDQEPNVAVEWPLKVLDEQMTGCGTSQAQNGRESVGSLLCTVSGGCYYSSESVCILQYNESRSQRVLYSVSLGEAVLAGEQVWQWLRGVKRTVLPGGAVVSYGQ